MTEGLGKDASPFIILVGVRVISRMGTRTPGIVPPRYTFREAGNGWVMDVASREPCPLPLPDPVRVGSGLLMGHPFCQIKKPHHVRCGWIRLRGRRLFPLPYAGIIQVRF